MKRHARCYRQVNQGARCFEWYETASRDAARRARSLRAEGYDVSVKRGCTMQTRAGEVRLTLVIIRPGLSGGDTTEGIPRVRMIRASAVLEETRCDI